MCGFGIRGLKEVLVKYVGFDFRPTGRSRVGTKIAASLTPCFGNPLAEDVSLGGFEELPLYTPQPLH